MKAMLLGFAVLGPVLGLAPMASSAAPLAAAQQQSNIVEKVRAIIIDKLGVEADRVTRDASFVDDLGADPLDVIELRMEISKEFNFEITDDEAEKMVTVGDAINLVYGKSGQ